MMTSCVWGLARRFCQKRQAKQEKAAAARTPVTHQNQNQPLGISTGALMSRMSPLKAFVPAVLVAEEGARMMTAEELVFIYIAIHDDGAFPVSQRISPARRRKAGLFATGSSRFALRETV